MNRRPELGDIVYLNDRGMDIIGGLRGMEMVRQAQRMIVTYVTPESLTQPEATWGIEVDQPLINRFLLSHHDVELIERQHKPFIPPRHVRSVQIPLEEAIKRGIATERWTAGGLEIFINC